MRRPSIKKSVSGPTNQFKLVSKQLVLRANCPNVYSVFQGKDETDAGRLERSDSKEEQPKNLKEWFHESKAVAKRLASSKVYVLNNISGRVVCQKNV